MELRHLRSFVAVAEERHFGRAAARLHIAQPPLSQQIRRLEDELGATLLHRTTRSVELAPAGEVLLVRAREILAAVDSATEDARRAARGEKGAVGNGAAGKVDIRNMLADTAQCARRRGAKEVEVEHLLRSALAAGEHAAGGMLERLGVAPDRVLAELDAAPHDSPDCLEA